MLNYVQIASLALLSYDTLVTLSSEVTYIWPQKLRLGTVFYLLSRYAALLVLIFSVIVNLSSLVTSLNVCNIMFRIPGGLNLLAVTGEQGLLLARAYAISKRNKVVLWALGLVYISTLGLTVFISVKNSCTITDQELNVILKAQTAKNILFILFDTSVVAITLGIIRLPIKSQVFGEQTTSQTLVNQGGIRYGFVLTIALTNTIVTKTVNPRISTILSSVQDRSDPDSNILGLTPYIACPQLSSIAVTWLSKRGVYILVDPPPYRPI
ncbi:hypothetical protein JB92DRAFT_3016983 [Gautieria morchelliformis]|nr:hypothetical protein JB92DRAFT_3016983 [Gautieria morchelliformis]